MPTLKHFILSVLVTYLSEFLNTGEDFGYFGIWQIFHSARAYFVRLCKGSIGTAVEARKNKVGETAGITYVAKIENARRTVSRNRSTFLAWSDFGLTDPWRSLIDSLISRSSSSGVFDFCDIMSGNSFQLWEDGRLLGAAWYVFMKWQQLLSIRNGFGSVEQTKDFSTKSTHSKYQDAWLQMQTKEDTV